MRASFCLVVVYRGMSTAGLYGAKWSVLPLSFYHGRTVCGVLCQILHFFCPFLHPGGADRGRLRYNLLYFLFCKGVYSALCGVLRRSVVLGGQNTVERSAELVRGKMGLVVVIL